MFNHNNVDSILRLKRNRKEQRNSLLNDSQFIGRITSISGADELAAVSGVPSKVVITHPFLSLTSWDRAIPEVGSTIMVEYNKNINEAIMDGYRLLTPRDSIDNYKSGTGLYMELAPGEFQRLSSGMAYTFHGNRPIKESFAGLVGYRLDGDSNTYIEKSATFIREMHQHKVGTLEDFSLLGVVRRPVTSVTTKLIKDTIDNCFAKENTLVLVNKKRKLLDYREGNVVSDLGIFDVCSFTGNTLRVQKKVFTINDNYTLKEIDTLGNIFIQTPSDAVNGIKVSISSGRLVMDVGKDLSLTVTKDTVMTSNANTTITSTGNNTAEFGAYLTKLGLDASHPLIYGDSLVKALLQFLLSASVHVHPGVAASPDFAAACTTLASSLPNTVSRNVETT